MLISYIGLSHLSLNYSAASLKMGHHVQILDTRIIVDQFKKKELNFYEPGLNETLDRYSKKINYDFDFKKLTKSDLIFIGVDVITNAQNKVIYDRLDNLISSTLKHLKGSKIPLIIMSQVEPGYTRKIKYNQKFLYHYVETLIFGKALERAVNPERIIIGKINSNHKPQLKLRKYLKEFKCELIEMKFEESELTKAFINIYLASQLATTNNLANLATSMNASWKVIRKALILDKRIGEYSYTFPGLGIAGGNIERDIKTLKDLSLKQFVKKNYFQYLIGDNLYFKNWLFRKISSYDYRDKKIAILGVTYKEDTLSCKNAPSLELIKNLKLENLLLHDRRASDLALPKKIIDRFFDLNTILNTSEILVILHNIDLYKKINLKNKKVSLVIDPFNILKIKINSKISQICISN